MVVDGVSSLVRLKMRRPKRRCGEAKIPAIYVNDVPGRMA